MRCFSSRACCFAILLFVGFGAQCAQAQNAYFTRIFDNPNAYPQTPGNMPETQAHGLNDSGIVVGMYGDFEDTFHAFEWQNGQFLPGNFDFPDSSCSFGCGSELNGINNSGEVVGDYTDSNGITHGYYIIKGKAVSFDPPFAGLTIATAVNSSGVIVGLYDDISGLQHGFEYDGTHFTSFDVPGCRNPEVEGVDDLGDVSGWCLGQQAGFKFNPALDALTPITGPAGAEQARSTGINNLGQIVGTFIDGVANSTASFSPAE